MKKTTLFVLGFMLSSFILIGQTPANDLPCGATMLTVNLDGNCIDQVLSFDGTETDSNMGTPNCANYSNKDLWYKFDMPANGAVRIKASAESAIDDLAIELFSGADCNSLVSFDCDDDGNPDGFPDDLFPQIDVIQPAESTVYFRVWDLDDVGIGSLNICLYKIDPPQVSTNDECSTATDLILSSDCSAPVLTTNFQSTDSPDATPSCVGGLYAGKDVWYKIIIDDNDDYNITLETFEDTGSSVYDTGMAVYTGSCGSLTEIDCNDDKASTFFSRIDLTNRRNEVLYIRVYTVDVPQNGTFNICASATGTLGVLENELNKFKLYPNPVKDIVNIKFNTPSNNKIDLNVYDIQGNLVLNTVKYLQNNRTLLNLENLKSGVYFLKAYDGESELTKKLIIK